MNASDVIHSGPTDLHVYIKSVFNLFLEFFSVKSKYVTDVNKRFYFYHGVLQNSYLT